MGKQRGRTTSPSLSTPCLPPSSAEDCRHYCHHCHHCHLSDDHHFYDNTDYHHDDNADHLHHLVIDCVQICLHPVQLLSLGGITIINNTIVIIVIIMIIVIIVIIASFKNLIINQ